MFPLSIIVPPWVVRCYQNGWRSRHDSDSDTRMATVLSLLLGRIPLSLGPKLRPWNRPLSSASSLKLLQTQQFSPQILEIIKRNSWQSVAMQGHGSATYHLGSLCNWNADPYEPQYNKPLHEPATKFSYDEGKENICWYQQSAGSEWGNKKRCHVMSPWTWFSALQGIGYLNAE